MFFYYQVYYIFYCCHSYLIKGYQKIIGHLPPSIISLQKVPFRLASLCVFTYETSIKIFMRISV